MKKSKKTRRGSASTPKTTEKKTVLTGRDAWIARLQNGETVSFREGGNSMTPRIKSRQKCTYVPVHSLDDIRVGDAVYCRVGSNYFTHLVTAIKGEQVQISNNHGHVNGWTNLAHIYGKVVPSKISPQTRLQVLADIMCRANRVIRRLDVCGRPACAASGRSL